jgi:hypothetical protein
MPGILLAVRVFCSWHTGNSLPVPGKYQASTRAGQPLIAAGEADVEASVRNTRSTTQTSSKHCQMGRVRRA